MQIDPVYMCANSFYQLILQRSLKTRRSNNEDKSKGAGSHSAPFFDYHDNRAERYRISSLRLDLFELAVIG